MSNHYEAFVFDLDGTLLNTLPDLVVLTNRALTRYGFPERTTEEILSYVGNGIQALMRQALPQNVDSSAVESTLAYWKNNYHTYGTELTEEYPGIREVLISLKQNNCKLAVLSNKFEKGVVGLIECFYPDVFSVVHGEGPTIPRKPDPAGLLKTLSELGTAPEKAVYIGDSPGDILTAKRAGVEAIGVVWGYHKENALVKAEAQMIAQSPEDILVLSGHAHFAKGYEATI